MIIVGCRGGGSGSSTFTHILFRSDVSLQVEGTWPNISCIRILLREPNHGTLVQPQGDFSFRVDAGDSFQFELLVSRFGKPLPGIPVQIKLSKPKLLRLVSGPPITDEKGIVSLTINTSDPHNPRKVIDGDLAKIQYKVPNQESFNDEAAIHVLVFDSYRIPSVPSWSDVFPIFRTQADLYPVMKQFINLDQLDDVIGHRKLLKMSMSLPFDHPNYMPVTRDLSNAKREMILQWLDRLEPPRGQGSSNQQLVTKKPAMSDGIPILESPWNSRNYNPLRQSLPSQINPRIVSTQTALLQKVKLIMKYERTASSNDNRDKTETSTEESLSLWSTDEQPPRVKKDPTHVTTTIENKIDLQQLRRDLQTALELEHSTIPPYLTALYSIKNGHNSKVSMLLKTIVVQEMLHMSLVANLLNAVGGKPVLTRPGFVPRYPTPLPSGIQQGLIVGLQNLSLPLIRDVFMRIEEPVLKIKDLEYQKHITKRMNDHAAKMNGWPRGGRGGISQDEGAGAEDGGPGERNEGWDCFPNSDFIGEVNRHRIEGVLIEPRHSTIGNFYQHILKTLAYLTNCGSNNTIFTGDPSRQLTSDLWYARSAYGHGQIVQVTDYFSAVKAIQEIVEQGEGSSPCMPTAADVSTHDLSHYFSFYSILKGRMVKMHEWHEEEPPAGLSEEVQQLLEVLTWWNDIRHIRGGFN